MRPLERTAPLTALMNVVLPAPVRPDQAQELARFYAYRHPGQRLQAAEADMQASGQKGRQPHHQHAQDRSMDRHKVGPDRLLQREEQGGAVLARLAFRPSISAAVSFCRMQRSAMTKGDKCDCLGLGRG